MSGLALNELNAIIAVATHLNFRAAAAEMDIPPSSLSHLVAKAERNLGIRLFNRSTRSVSLTEAGKGFLDRVRPALREIADAVEAVNHFRDTPTGVLRLNSSEQGADRVLPIILDFMRACPDMRVDLVSEGRLIDIVAEGFDAGVRLVEAVPQDMISIPLGTTEEFAVVGTADYYRERGTPLVPADLLEHECIRSRLPSGAIHRWEFERKGEELRLDPPGRLTLGSPELSHQAARTGMGLAYLTERSARDDLASGRLVRVLQDWTPPFEGVALYYPSRRLPSAGLRAFITHFQRKREEAR